MLSNDRGQYAPQAVSKCLQGSCAVVDTQTGRTHVSVDEADIRRVQRHLPVCIQRQLVLLPATMSWISIAWIEGNASLNGLLVPAGLTEVHAKVDVGRDVERIQPDGLAVVVLPLL